MLNLLLSFFNKLFETAVNRLLTGAGLTLASGAGLYTMITNLVDDVIANLSTAPQLFLNFMGLSGFDVALSLILGACIARVTITQASLFLTRY